MARPGPSWPRLPTACWLSLTLLAAIKESIRQLRDQADFLLLALALSNPAVLQQGPLHVLGTVYVTVGEVSTQTRRSLQRMQLSVGGKGPVPAAVMQLQIKT